MNKPTKILTLFCTLTALASCDTVEDAFSVGEKPKDNEILSLDQSQLAFKPDGGSYEIQVSSIARWEVSMANNNAGQFSVSPATGKGNGTVTVTCKPNSTQNSFNVELSVTPLNFVMDPVKVSLRQNNATFSIERIPSSEPVPEEGGSVTMTAYSSLSWKIVALPHDADGNIGDLSWLAVTPGLSGEGGDGNTPIEYRFSWTPNYTLSQRTIRLQLKPSTDMELAGLPQPFTLTQLPGTLPQDVRCQIDRLGVVDADLTLEYSSRSPIKDCGVRVYQTVNGNSSLLTTVRPDAQEFSLTGNYRLSLKDLAENSNFKIEPFVENEVGTKVGDSREIATGTKPENMTYHGVSIENADNGGISIVSDLTSATITFTVVSDVTPLGSDRLSSVTMNVSGKSIVGTSRLEEEGRWIYEFKATDLEPNHEYEYSIAVAGKDIPRDQGVIENNSLTLSGKFKTQGMSPDSDHNEKPNVGS